MSYDKNTKLIILDKVVIGGEEFLMTTREREDWERNQLQREKRVRDEIESSPNVYKLELSRLKKMYDDYSLIYSTKANNTLDKFNNLDIKKIFGEKGVHIFDIKKNELSIGDMNKIKFKIRENEDENIKTLEQKIKLHEKIKSKKKIYNYLEKYINNQSNLEKIY